MCAAFSAAVRCWTGSQPGLKHRLQTIRLGPTQRVQLRQGGHTGPAGQLVRPAALCECGTGRRANQPTANAARLAAAGSGRASCGFCAMCHQARPTQLLQLSGLHPQRRQGRGRVQWQLRIGGIADTAKRRAYRRQPTTRASWAGAKHSLRVGCLSRHKMQQPGGAFGVTMLQGVLQDQQLTTSHRLHQDKSNGCKGAGSGGN